MTTINTVKKAITLAALGVAAMASIAMQSAAAPLSEIKENGVVRIGMLVDFPPFGFLNAEGQMDGYDHDVAQAFAKRLGVKAEIVQVTGPNRIPYLLSDKIDVVIGSLGITPERAEQVRFSHPYAAMLNVVYGDSGVLLKDGAGMSGHTIAITRASVQDDALMKVSPSDAIIQRYDDDASAVQALMSGQSELLAVDTVTILDIDKRKPGAFDVKFELTAQVQGIAVAKGNDDLAASVDAFVNSMLESGELNTIHERWFHRPLPAAVTGQ
ncbi:MAG: transporter substrate-binding domain-containing protein [Mesorhizobium sp.]